MGARAGGPESRSRRAGEALAGGLGTIRGRGGVRVPRWEERAMAEASRPPDSPTQERGKEGVGLKEPARARGLCGAQDPNPPWYPGWLPSQGSSGGTPRDHRCSRAQTRVPRSPRRPGFI